MSGCDQGSAHRPSDPAAPTTLSAPGPIFQDPRSVSRALGRSVLEWDKIGVAGRWLVNSHPKSGTHLIRNILLHFNANAVHQDILFFNTFGNALSQTAEPRIFIGHIPYGTLSGAAATASGLRTVLLLRHPGAIALALARAFYDRNSTRPDHLYMREHDSFEQIVSKVVTGYECRGQQFGSLASSLADFCLDWLGNVQFVVRFEDMAATLQSNDDDLLAFFNPVLGQMLQIVPPDAAQRIRAGAAAAISATYSRTVESVYDALRPEEIYTLLPPAEGEGLRRIAVELGY
jgi:hypothetical protein